ncbi:MAG: geranylgeranyl reductase family protein [Nitrospirae bacterium]|nr:geranylgeranyl reductase family protein [Nitrospirota bacterium]
MTASASYDVAVVGAGPAGATAARELALAGLRVALLEKAPLPRYKVCGGGLVGRSLRALPEKTLREVAAHPCATALMGVPALGREFVTRRSTPIVAMVMRDRLDRALTGLAQDAGATLVAEAEVTGLDTGPHRVTLATRKGPLTAATVIAADGVNSRLARLAGWAPNPHAVPAVEWEVRVPDATYRRFAGRARFDMVIPGGYAWVFPKGAGHLSVGAMTILRQRMDLHGRVARYLAGLGIHPAGEPARHGHQIPIAPRARCLARGPVLLAGDAAGLADPVTGEGISHALGSGTLAAQAVLAAGGDPARAAARYQALLEQSILPDLRAARRFAELYYLHPRVTAWGFRLWGQTICEQVTEVMMGRRGYHQLRWDIVPAMLGLGRAGRP